MCNGRWTGQPTKLGAKMTVGRTIAVDPRVIPLGSKIRLGGRVYTAEDTGETIKGKRIDLYVENHEQAIKFVKKLIGVYIER